MHLFYTLTPSWTDIVTALSTGTLVVLAGFSAYYAYHLWLEARVQFAEMKRSTDMDIVLQMLARCDDPGLFEAELGIGALHNDGKLESFAIFDGWIKAFPPGEARFKIWKHIATIFGAYEQIGILVRKAPETADVLVDYLCLRAPQMFDFLRPIIDQERLIAPTSHCEFEDLVARCREFVKRHDPGATLRGVSL